MHLTDVDISLPPISNPPQSLGYQNFHSCHATQHLIQAPLTPINVEVRVSSGKSAQTHSPSIAPLSTSSPLHSSPSIPSSFAKDGSRSYEKHYDHGVRDKVAANVRNAGKAKDAAESKIGDYGKFAQIHRPSIPPLSIPSPSIPCSLTNDGSRSQKKQFDCGARDEVAAKVINVGMAKEAAESKVADYRESAHTRPLSIPPPSITSPSSSSSLAKDGSRPYKKHFDYGARDDVATKVSNAGMAKEAAESKLRDYGKTAEAMVKNQQENGNTARFKASSSLLNLAEVDTNVPPTISKNSQASAVL